MTISTSVFGMNIWEMNKGAPKFCAVIAVMVGLVLLAFLVYFIMKWLENWNRNRKERIKGRVERDLSET